MGTVSIHFTRPFWGALLIGLGFGLFLGASLIESVILGSRLFVVPSMELIWLGMFLARKAAKAV